MSNLYLVTKTNNSKEKESFGMLFHADIKRFAAKLQIDIEKIIATTSLLKI